MVYKMDVVRWNLGYVFFYILCVIGIAGTYKQQMGFAAMTVVQDFKRIHSISGDLSRETDGLFSRSPAHFRRFPFVGGAGGERPGPL